jgi:hypothetical protein
MFERRFCVRRIFENRFCPTFSFLSHFFRLRYENNGNNKGTILPFTEKNECVSSYIFTTKLLRFNCCTFIFGFVIQLIIHLIFLLIILNFQQGSLLKLFPGIRSRVYRFYSSSTTTFLYQLTVFIFFSRRRRDNVEEMQHQEPQFSMDRMPPEIVLRILSFVRHDDYRSLRLTCRRFNQLSKKPELWTKVCSS